MAALLLRPAHLCRCVQAVVSVSAEGIKSNIIGDEYQDLPVKSLSSADKPIINMSIKKN